MNRYILAFLLMPIAVALGTLLIISVILSSTNRHIYRAVEQVPAADAALILGAAVLKSGRLSPVLKDRVDQAIELYRAGKVERIIASGNSNPSAHNEVQPIASYLLEAGIPEEDILLDFAGFDTYSSIYRAKHVFGVASLAVVSQSFHLPRAVFIAKKLGIEASGMSADRGHYKLINYFREMLADVKAVFNLLSRRTPAYLGEGVPLPQEQLQEGFIIPLW